MQEARPRRGPLVLPGFADVFEEDPIVETSGARRAQLRRRRRALVRSCRDGGGFRRYHHADGDGEASTRRNTSCELGLTRPARPAISELLAEDVAAAAVEFITGPLLEAPYRVGRPLRDTLSGFRSVRLGTQWRVS